MFSLEAISLNISLLFLNISYATSHASAVPLEALYVSYYLSYIFPFYSDYCFFVFSAIYESIASNKTYLEQCIYLTYIRSICLTTSSAPFRILIVMELFQNDHVSSFQQLEYYIKAQFRFSS